MTDSVIIPRPTKWGHASLAVAQTQPGSSRMLLEVTSPVEAVHLFDIRNSHHPFLRPFDIFTKSGEKNVGAVTFLFLAVGEKLPLYVPLSIAVIGHDDPPGHPLLGRR